MTGSRSSTEASVGECLWSWPGKIAAGTKRRCHFRLQKGKAVSVMLFKWDGDLTTFPDCGYQLQA